MKKITARVVFEYDFTEMIQEQNEERAVSGEPDMSKDEIRAFIEEDLYSFDFNDAVGGVDINIEIS